MAEPTSRSARKVRDALAAAGGTYAVQELPASTRSAQQAADSIGCRLSQIVKSLVFRGATSGRPWLLLVSGANRVDEQLLAQVTGESIAKADARFVRQHTGFAIGGVPPVGHPEPLATLIDEDLLQHEELWAAAGTPNAVFPLPAADLVRLTGGQVVAVR